MSLENGGLIAFISVDIVGMVCVVQERGIATVDVAQDTRTLVLVIKVHKRLLHTYTVYRETQTVHFS